MSRPKSPPPPPPPPPPPGPAPVTVRAPKPLPHTTRPTVSQARPGDCFLVELLVYNGAPFLDHWAYWVATAANSDYGVKMHATGDVRNGFTFEVKRSHSLEAANEQPTERVPLQWVDAGYFDERAMHNYGEPTIDDQPVCGFEKSAFRAAVPGKTLTSVSDDAQETTTVPAGTRITLRNCQTWIVESADKLVEDGILERQVAAYLYAIKQ